MVERYNSDIPTSPTELTSALDILGMEGGGNTVKQIDDALFPTGADFVQLIAKTRIPAGSQPFIDHILAVAIQTGKFKVPIATPDKSLNAGEALVIAHALTQIAIRGESRKEFTNVLRGIGGAMRAPFRMFRGRQSSYGANPL